MLELATGAGNAVRTEETFLFTPSFVANWNESEDWVVRNPTTMNRLRQAPLGIVLNPTGTKGTTASETLCERLRMSLLTVVSRETGREVGRAKVNVPSDPSNGVP